MFFVLVLLLQAIASFQPVFGDGAQQPSDDLIIASPYLLHDLETDFWIENATGLCIIAWQPGTQRAFFIAFAIWRRVTYKFVLTEVFNCTNEEILGRWDVEKDGGLVCENCIGHVYGLTEPVGSYFKLYVGNETTYYEGWHLSGWIIRRVG